MTVTKESTDVERSGASRRRDPSRGVLMCVHDFPPDMAMGAQACAQIGRYLPCHGWEPTVLTIRERYIENLGTWSDAAFPGRVVRTRVLPHPVTLYRRLKSVLGRGANDTHGEGSSGNGDIERLGTFKRWILSLVMIGDPFTGWCGPAIAAGLRVVARESVDHLFSSGPPWTSHLVGLALSTLTGRPLIAHFRDPWTHSPPCKPVSALTWRIDQRLERMVVERASFVASVTAEHTEMFRSTYDDLPPDKFVTIPNGFDEAEWQGVDRERIHPGAQNGRRFVISYAGELYSTRNPLPIFRALRSLIECGVIDPKNVLIELIGRCEVAAGRRVDEMAEECGMRDCVSVLGPKPRTETLQNLASSDLLLLLAEGLTAQIPGKTYEYLRAGRPILALTSEGAVADLLRKAGGSWAVDPADDKGIMAAIRQAYELWTEGLPLPRPDESFVSGFDRKALAQRFAELFDRSAK